MQDALEAITEVRDEFQEKYDELENPDGARGEKLQEKIDELSFVDDIDPESPGADDFTTLDQYLHGITNPNLS